MQRANCGELDVRLPTYNAGRTVHAAHALIDMPAEQVALGLTTTLTAYAQLWPSAESRVRDACARLAAEVLTAGEGR